MSNNKNQNEDDKSELYKAYMQRIKNEKIPVYEPSFGKEEINNLTDVIKSAWISEGKYTREFEKRLSDACQRKYALAFSSATAAIITGMKSLGIGPGHEVIVPSFSHSADPNSISAVGATPIFAEIDEATLCLSPTTIDKTRTEKTKAVLFVSAYGNVGDLEEITDYCSKNNIILINDCAPALFGTYRGKSIASYGDFSVLSFFADKTITTGEGGMLLTDDLELINECNIYKHDGRKERGHDLIERRGYNFRITELQSAVGVAQLDKINHFVERKKEILIEYERALKGTNRARLFKFNVEGDIVPHRVIIIVDQAKPLIKHLENLGIGARTLFMPMHSQPCYNVKTKFEKTEKLYEQGIELPSAPTLSNKDIKFISDSIKEYYEVQQ